MVARIPSHSRSSEAGVFGVILTSWSMAVKWRPVGDLNPCYRDENPVSWTWLDERDAKKMKIHELRSAQLRRKVILYRPEGQYTGEFGSFHPTVS